MTYISAELRQKVVERAGSCCEYCRMSQDSRLFSFAVDHIIATKHEGETVLENLALSCPACNSHKGSDVASFDPYSGELTALFNPRTQQWADHFRLMGALIEPLTPTGRVTVRILKLNLGERVIERGTFMADGSYPCSPLDK